jgi:hypothetical protein
MGLTAERVYDRWSEKNGSGPGSVVQVLSSRLSRLEWVTKDG